MGQRKSHTHNFELYKNENNSYQNFWDAAKAVFREKCLPLLNACIWKNILKISDLSFYLKKLDNEGQIKPKGKVLQDLLQILQVLKGE